MWRAIYMLQKLETYRSSVFQISYLREWFNQHESVELEEIHIESLQKAIQNHTKPIRDLEPVLEKIM